MPFLVIRGSFHPVGKAPQGNPSGFQLDGDSMQFKPDKRHLLDRLDQVDKPYRLTSIGSTQLRFEGIDAFELHVEGDHQPRPLAAFRGDPPAAGGPDSPRLTLAREKARSFAPP
jgi:hypothetical protein